MDTGQWIVILLSVLIGGWYIGGYLINRRLTQSAVQWLQSGLDLMGGVREVEKMGTFAPGAKLLVPKATRPFKRFEAAFILESRENLPFWIYYHLRGKRDELLLKGFFSRSSGFELEVARSGNRGFQDWMAEPDNRRLKEVPSPDGYQVYLRGAEAEKVLKGLRHLLTDYGGAVDRLSIRPKSPHLSIKAELIPLLGISPAAFFNAVKGVVEGQPGASRE